MKLHWSSVASILTISLIGAACTEGAPSAVTVPTVAAPTTTTVAPSGTVGCTQDRENSYRPTGPVPNPATFRVGSVMADIRRSGKLRVGTAADVLQFSARNPLPTVGFANGGEIQGFDIDMLHEISRAIFGDPNKLEFHIITYAQRIPAIRNNEVDIVAHTMTINCTRWTKVAFSSEYYHAGQKILVRNDSTVTDIAQLTNKRVCVAKGSTNIDELKKHPVVAVPVDDLGTCLVMFQQGAVDAITGDDSVLAGFAAQDPYAKVVGKAFTDEPYGLAMKLDPQHREFVEFVNALLERMRGDGTWKGIYCRWLAGCANGQLPAGQSIPVAKYGR